MSGSFGREYPTRPIVGVGAVVVITAADRVVLGIPSATTMPGIVLVKRRFEPLAGQWSLPGGALEVGETLKAGVAREVAEETGLSVEVGPVLDVFDRLTFDDHRRVQYHFVLIDYLCRPTGGGIQAGSDVADVAVADAHDLAPFRLTPEADAVIRRALAQTSSSDSGVSQA